MDGIQKQRIPVVDDDKDIARLARQYLEQAGFLAITAPKKIAVVTAGARGWGWRFQRRL